MVALLRALGADYVLDTNFAADLTIVEEASELIRRITEKDRRLPQFTSCCPGWVHFAEIYAPEMLPHLSSAKSPIGMQGATVKTYFAQKMGLDPKQILEIRALIRELAQEHTVILSSHILSEVQEVCDHIFIIHHGRLVAQGTPAQLERELAGTPAITLLLKAAPEEGRVLLSGVPGVAEVAPLPCGEAGAALLRLTPAEGADPREAVFRACAGADLPILEMRRESLSLEQIFLELTSDASAAGQAGGRRRPFGRRDSAEPEPEPAITEHGEEAEP